MASKWVTEVITLLVGDITPFITGRSPHCGDIYIYTYNYKAITQFWKGSISKESSRKEPLAVTL